jgi:endonuclease YncB( thermonuclease family)
MCHFWTGKATAVDDGDTITVDIDGDHTSRPFVVRLSTVQAMELSDYRGKHRRGECHGVEATLRLEQLIKRSGWRVRLAAQDPNSHADKRLSRSVAVKMGGRWQDAGAVLMREGQTLWMPGSVEDAWNATYDRLTQEAHLKGIGMWNPTHCGVGPHQDVPLRAWVNWDPVGVDTEQVANEWVKIQNTSATATLPLGGWWIRDSFYRRLTFKPGTEIGPGETLTVYTGHGTDTRTSAYWNLDTPMFQNPGDSHQLGDGAYLFDPQGDLRLGQQYPCLVACSDPLEGAVEITVQPRGLEYLLLRNVSGKTIDLYGYQLLQPGYQLVFQAGSKLGLGEAMRINAAGNPKNDTRLLGFWGINSHPMFSDGGGALRLANFTGMTLACDAWGAGSC